MSGSIDTNRGKDLVLFRRTIMARLIIEEVHDCQKCPYFSISVKMGYGCIPECSRILDNEADEFHHDRFRVWVNINYVENSIFPDCPLPEMTANPDV